MLACLTIMELMCLYVCICVYMCAYVCMCVMRVMCANSFQRKRPKATKVFAGDLGIQGIISFI